MKLFILLLLFCAGLLSAAEKEMDTGSGYVIFPIAFYTSDTSFGGGATAVLYKRQYKLDDEERSDSLAAVFFYTVKNQLLGALVGNKYSSDAKLHYKSTLVVSKFPSDFYGIGNYTDKNDREVFTPFQVKVENILEARLFEKVYAGVVLSQGYYHIWNFGKDGLLNNYINGERHSGIFSGIGFIIDRDSRDDSLVPTKGSLTTLSATTFYPLIFSDYRFTAFQFDHKHYHSIPLKSVIAWEILFNAVSDGAPLNYLPELGSQNMMRGFPAGRYRDNIYLAAQTEWRVPIYWRIGAVLFASAGKVQHSFDEYLFSGVHYSGGAGLRFTLSEKKKINFRFDFGYSSDKSYKLYFNILEAF